MQIGVGFAVIGKTYILVEGGATFAGPAVAAIEIVSETVDSNAVGRRRRECKSRKTGDALSASLRDVGVESYAEFVLALLGNLVVVEGGKATHTLFGLGVN